ncbi:pro-resilin-like [Pollicipes pollicipes]|uniref:pro-resilin-like n=1 Tax=Pollicipes pollicipes TaxID=41117 RepID=UPI0018850D6E|nr:pro-resilin-like [Pollicipes pollicipes]
MPYSFNWLVDQPEYGNLYDHGEDSDGLVTSGEYRVLLPDGRTQVVRYTVEGDSGYQAQVAYEGEAQFPSRADSPVGPGPYRLGAGAAFGATNGGRPGIGGAAASAVGGGPSALGGGPSTVSGGRSAVKAGPSTPSTSYGY